MSARQTTSSDTATAELLVSYAIASLHCQGNQQNCYIARLVVRLEVKLSPLGRAHPIFCCALSPGEDQRKVEAHINKFSAPPLSNCFRRHCLAGLVFKHNYKAERSISYI